MLNCKVKKKMNQIHFFGEEFAPPPLSKHLLGVQGTGLAEMAYLRLPVPPGFIVTTDAYLEYCQNGKQLSQTLIHSILQNLSLLEKKTGCILGDVNQPLLISVRSGTEISMPGMMDTILNIGLNDLSVQKFTKIIGSERLAYDNYRHFISTYGEIVCHINKNKFEQAFNAIKTQEGADLDIDISEDGLKEACERFKRIYIKECGYPFPQDCREQLLCSIKAIFDRWDSERSILYRQVCGVTDDLGTAVTVQKMVFGNKNKQSAAGIVFTRDPSTGENCIYGDYQIHAQGQEAIDGIKTPRPISIYQKRKQRSDQLSLEELMPDLYLQLKQTVKKLECYYKEIQNVEFTIEDGTLYMLKTRECKKTGFAAIRIAKEMLQEGMIEENDVVQKVNSQHFQQLFAPIFNEDTKAKHKDKLVAIGIQGSPGAAFGLLALSPLKAKEMKENGIPCILVQDESTVEDFSGIIAAEGVLTLRGCFTSHVAVMTRSLGKPSIVACEALHINETAKTLSVGDHSLKEGEPISIDGSTGEIFFCELETSPSELFKVLVTKEIEPDHSLIYQLLKCVVDLTDKEIYKNKLHNLKTIYSQIM